MRKMNKNSKIYQLLFTESVKILNRDLDKDEEKEMVEKEYEKELKDDGNSKE